MDATPPDGENATPAAIDAHVSVSVTIKPSTKECTASVALEIEARNTSDVSIPFTKPYVLPTRFALNIKASDDDGPLHPTFTDNKLSVPFPRRRPISGHGRFRYKISFDRTIDVKRDGSALIVIYKIPPQNTFQDVAVNSHEFDCTFKILKPPEDTWRRLKEYRVILVDNRRVINDVSHDSDGTTCKLASFPTGPNDPETVLTFVCIYQLTSRLGPLAVGVVATILRLLARATVGLLFRR